jgi:hypothetical protein
MGSIKMDEVTRLGTDVNQLTRRLDDYSMRLAIVETEVKNFDEKFARIEAAIEKWNRTGYWLMTVVIGSMLLAVLRFIYEGGLAPLAKAAGI